MTTHLSGDRAIAFRKMMEAGHDAAEALRRCAAECRTAHGL